MVTPVKNHDQYTIKTGTLNSLSEQDLMDCARFQYECLGCNGGQTTEAMKYAAKEGGLCSQSEYKATAKDDTNQDYEAVTLTVTAAGCVSIDIEADHTAFQHYSSSVLTGNCRTSIDTDVSQKYMKVKKGYFNVCRDCDTLHYSRDLFAFVLQLYLSFVMYDISRNFVRPFPYGQITRTPSSNVLRSIHSSSNNVGI